MLKSSITWSFFIGHVDYWIGRDGKWPGQLVEYCNSLSKRKENWKNNTKSSENKVKINGINSSHIKTVLENSRRSNKRRQGWINRKLLMSNSCGRTLELSLSSWFPHWPQKKKNYTWESRGAVYFPLLIHVKNRKRVVIISAGLGIRTT